MEALADVPATEPLTDEQLIELLAQVAPAPEQKLKVSFPPDAYRKAITFIAGVSPKKSTLPVLSMIHCQSNGATTFRASDLDIFASVEVPEVAAVEGECLIPRTALLAALKSGKRTVAIELRPKLMVDIVTDGMKQTVPSISVEDFVPLPKYEPSVRLKVSASMFKEALKRCALAMSEDASRYVLNGVAIECSPNGIVLVATDGRRLHKVEMHRLDYDSDWAARLQELEANSKAAAEAMEKFQQDQRFTLIVPTATVEHLLKLPITTYDILSIEAEPMKDGGENVPAPWCAFQYERIGLISRQIQGRYPNFRQVIPHDMKEKIRLEADALATAVNQVKTITTEKEVSVKLTFTGQKLTVSASSVEKGQSSTEIATNYDGKDVGVALNPKYLLDALTAFKGLEIEFGINDELCPVKLVNGSTLAVIMPMRLS